MKKTENAETQVLGLESILQPRLVQDRILSLKITLVKCKNHSNPPAAGVLGHEQPNPCKL
jgi:hypothetical protein